MRPPAPDPTDATSIGILCADGVRLAGHLWRSAPPLYGTVILNPATGVLARYYHRYAQFLAAHGFCAVTYDYRGIGLSRPERLRGLPIAWRDWGERDVEAVLAFVGAEGLPRPLAVVGHSIGGVLIGFAPRAASVDRILSVGAQYAYWRDYAAAHRRRLFWRWHVVMPALTAIFGYFPGRRLGWLEDLPAGVAYEWSFKRAALEADYPAADRAAVRARFAAVHAPLLAVTMTDDEYGTEAALRRALAYFSGAERQLAMLEPAAFGEAAIGHFEPFHARLRDSFWPATLTWLRDGVNPWPQARLQPANFMLR